jgi:outer membrane protein assembly factor BamB
MRFLFLLGLLTAACPSTATRAEHNWPRFRGPNADGVAPDNTGLPTTWTTTENVKWVADLPGWGWSCPVVWGDRVFLTTVVSDEENLTPSKGLYLGEGVRDPAKGIHHWLVYCFDLNTGKELWKHEAHTGRPKVPRHPKSTYASETPTTDGERLYALFGDLGLYCYDLNGKPLWSKRIEPRRTFFDYGAAASPVVHDGQVIVVYDNLEGSWIGAFDAKTGDERWRTSRDETHSWATPFVWTNELRTEIVVPGKKRNRSYSLEGELLWEFDGKMSNLVIPSPFAAHGLCYIASGYVGDNHRPTFAVRPGASGDVAPDGDFENSEYVAWYQGRSSSYNPSQIVYGDYLYTLYDRGFLTCHDAKTGKEVFGKQRFFPSGSFTASPFAFNGHLFFLSEDGLTYVMKAGPEFDIVERNDLDELCISSPAVAGDKLLIRTASKLYCLTGGAKLDAAASARLEPRRKASSASDIWSAAAEGNRDEMARLLTAGTSVNARQAGSGSTPLNTAALFGQTDVAKLLIDKGAHVSTANNDGNTALHIASFFANAELVELLLEKGASVSVKNGRGETPLDVVSADWSPQLEGIYKSIGALVGIELDLERIRQTRPKVGKLLREHAAKGAGNDSDSAVPRGASRH